MREKGVLSRSISFGLPWLFRDRGTPKRGGKKNETLTPL
jgi:hypothetical protein